MAPKGLSVADHHVIIIYATPLSAATKILVTSENSSLLYARNHFFQRGVSHLSRFFPLRSWERRTIRSR